eukprot:CAMPEP_0169185506 /NCGR_PEP_ID=MMETSP1016-20121227/1837_1 /TAXON_ID=342587 /ORGANISM="Karlodinium micrum, Strain CCMP2283" /LENGTH=824 /DNA_ID=CAMNT_0009261223 /DNA_START=101 /DNA_END=2575 /DNA_ORIENTATION=+
MVMFLVSIVADDIGMSRCLDDHSKAKDLAMLQKGFSRRFAAQAGSASQISARFDGTSLTSKRKRHSKRRKFLRTYVSRRASVAQPGTNNAGKISWSYFTRPVKVDTKPLKVDKISWSHVTEPVKGDGNDRDVSLSVLPADPGTRPRVRVKQWHQVRKPQNGITQAAASSHRTEVPNFREVFSREDALLNAPGVMESWIHIANHGKDDESINSSMTVSVENSTNSFQNDLGISVPTDERSKRVPISEEPEGVLSQALLNASGENSVNRLGSDSKIRSEQIQNQTNQETALPLAPALSYSSENASVDQNLSRALFNVSGDNGTIASEREIDVALRTGISLAPESSHGGEENTSVKSQAVLNMFEDSGNATSANFSSKSTTQPKSSISHASGVSLKTLGLEEKTVKYSESPPSVHFGKSNISKLSKTNHSVKRKSEATAEVERKVDHLRMQRRHPLKGKIRSNSTHPKNEKLTVVDAVKGREGFEGKHKKARPLSGTTENSSKTENKSRVDLQSRKDMVNIKNAKKLVVKEDGQAERQAEATNSEAQKGKNTHAKSSASIDAIAATINRMLTDVADGKVASAGNKSSEKSSTISKSEASKGEKQIVKAVAADQQKSTFMHETDSKESNDKQFSVNFALGQTVSLDQKGLETVIKHKDVAQMRQFLRRAIGDLGFVAGDENELHDLAEKCMQGKGPRDFESITEELSTTAVEKDSWIRLFRNPAHKDHIAYAFTKKENLNRGYRETLNEDGYEAIKKLKVKDNENMDVFICRVVNHLGLEIRDPWAFMGFYPWYDGTNAYQSFDALVAELKSKAWQPSQFVTTKGPEW